MNKTTTQLDIVREDRIRDILVKLNLSSEHLSYIKEKNPSTNLPYHGYQHLISVSIAYFNSGEYYFSSETDMIRPLFLAGLYHAWNHSGGDYEDSINVARAIVGMAEAVNELESFEHKVVDEIATLISVTEHPAQRSPQNTSEKIILDADKLQWTEPDFERWSAGLVREVHQNVTLETIKKSLITQSIYTSWARKIFFDKGMVDLSW